MTLEEPTPALGSKKEKKKGGLKFWQKESKALASSTLPTRKGEETQKISISEKFVRFAIRYTRGISIPLSEEIPALKDNVLKSNLNISPMALISVCTLLSLLMIPIAALGIYLMVMTHFYIGIIAMPVVAMLPLAMGIMIAKVSASSRSRALETELPFLIGYITVLAGGGISPLVTIKRICQADKIFPASAREARRILRDIEIFGMDAITALERATQFSANRVFSEFIGGYVAVLKTGGSAVSYLDSKLKEVFADREAKVRSSSDFIGNMAEAYIIMTVVMGISFMILFATSNLMAAGVTSVNPQMIIIFSGFAVPLISMMFIVVIGSAQIKEPIGYDTPYYLFLGCIPIAAVSFFVNFGIPIYYQLGIGLLLTTLPAAVLNVRVSQQKRAVEAKLSSFLRDVSEVRKTGLAPEKTIEQLASRDYGALSQHVQAISTQLSWGTPIRVVLQNFSDAVKSWVTKAMAFLLLEVVDVGGGSPKMFVNLADFTEKNAQLERERKALIRPFIIIPYIGAIMVVATTAMMIYFVSGPNLSFPGAAGAANYLPSQNVISQATTILLTASIFQAWIMGFVAGKMGESTVADGFKHACALVAISLITVIITKFFIKF